MLYGTASGLWGSIWHALGSNSAGVPLFRKHASRMRSSAMSAYTRRYVELSAMRLSIHAFVHAFSFFFLRVSQLLFGTASGDQFGTPWARILLGFRCFASMPHGCVHRLCPPICADMSSYIRHDAPIECFCPCFCCVFYGFRRCCTAPPLGINLARPGLEFCWGSAVSHACLTDAFIGHVHLPCAYVPLAVRHAPNSLLYARFCFVFTGFEDAVRHRLWGSIWHALGSNSAGVPLFRKHASRTRSSAMSTYYEPI